ncbi:MAG: GNAT family N-acetyltransferase [Lachnospiraceae bacterium]|nr:GNAT family N-acetyltransferase [Lachnospiraceae bacterium]
MEDLEEFYKLYGSPGMEFIEPLADYETEQEKLWSYIHNRYPFYGYGMWTVLDKTTGKVIGRAGIEERTIGERDMTELGYMLHYSYRRNGIGFEICQAILEYAKTTLYIEEIHAYTHRGNEASQRLLKKLGFSVEGEVCWREEELQQYCCELY